MDREYVDSEMIRSIGFDSSTSTLEVEFNSGAVWQYFDFPEPNWYGFRNAESKGKYFNREIRNRYSESRVG
jgi:hypothetical protein